MTDIAVLSDRKVLDLSGPEARFFLQNLITNDVDRLETGQARYAALLTPQGKIVSDFLVIATDRGFLIDAPAATGAELVRKFVLYRLRARVEVADRGGTLGVVAFAGEPPPAAVVQAYADPRDPAMWRRAVVTTADLGSGAEPAGRRAYDARRIASGVPEGGQDFAYGDTFPHEANMDRLHGIDFRKGCYVGQEVVSRVEHRGTARKRIVGFTFDGHPPPPGSDISTAEAVIGTFGSSAAGRGLGLVRTDRLAEAGGAVTAAGVALRPESLR